MSKSIRILVVDDCSTMRRIIRALLGDLGYTDVQEDGDGNAALDLLKAQPLITDCNMPAMTGLELLNAVRAEPATKAMPVLMVTAEGKRDQILESAQLGVSGYIMKPFTAETLKDRMESILQRIAA
jgi:two-component system, chemotaxis family, chemotaxis protein CheY